MMVFFVVFLLFFSVVLEGIFVAIPLVLTLLIVLQIVYRSGVVMIAAFLAGIFLDALLFRPLGQSSFFFLSFLTLLALYERRFEVQTYPFLLGSVIAGSTAYLVIFGSRVFFVQVVATLVLSLVLFVIFLRKNIDRNERLASR